MRTVPQKRVGALNVFSYHKRGRWYEPDYSINSPMSITLVANRLCVVPFYVGETVIVDGIGINCTAAVASSRTRLGIYESDLSDLPLPKSLILETADLDTGTTGIKSFLWHWETGLGKRIWLRAGKLYWLAVLSDSAVGVSGNYLPQWFLGVVGVESGADPRPVQYVFSDLGSYGSLPVTFPSPVALGSYKLDFQPYHPVIALRFSGCQDVEGMTLQLTVSRAYEEVGKGYFAGGSDTFAPLTEIDGLKFFDESFNNPSAVLSTGRSSHGAGNSSTRGYWGGGSDFTPTYFASVNGITFSTETAVNLGNRLSLARNTTGVNSATRLYFGGGYNGSNQSMIDGIRFDTEAAITTSATLATARRGHAGVNSSTKGYFMGGYSDTYVSEIDGIQFSDETAINPDAILQVARVTTGINSSTRGYAGGGSTGSNSDEIDGIQFSDETAINPSAVLGSPRRGSGGANAEWKGYWGGGYITSYSITFDGFSFLDEVRHAVAMTLADDRQYLAACQSGGWL